MAEWELIELGEDFVEREAACCHCGAEATVAHWLEVKLTAIEIAIVVSGLASAGKARLRGKLHHGAWLPTAIEIAIVVSGLASAGKASIVVGKTGEMKHLVVPKFAVEVDVVGLLVFLEAG